MKHTQREPVALILKALKVGESYSWPIERLWTVRNTTVRLQLESRGALRFSTTTGDGQTITVTRKPAEAAS